LVAIGSDAYSAALQVYCHVKAHGEGTGLDSLVDDLGQRFERKSHKEIAAQYRPCGWGKAGALCVLRPR